MSFAPNSTDFILEDGRVLLNGCVCSGTVNYNADGIGKDKGFPRNLVAVGGSGGPNVPWKKYEMLGPFLYFSSFFPGSK